MSVGLRGLRSKVIAATVVIVLAFQTLALTSAADATGSTAAKNEHLEVTVFGCETLTVKAIADGVELRVATTGGASLSEFSEGSWTTEVRLWKGHQATLRTPPGARTVTLSVTATQETSQATRTYALNVPVTTTCPSTPTRNPQVVASCVAGGVRLTNTSEHWASYLVMGRWTEDTGYKVLGNDFDLPPHSTEFLDTSSLPVAARVWYRGPETWFMMPGGIPQESDFDLKWVDCDFSEDPTPTPSPEPTSVPSPEPTGTPTPTPKPTVGKLTAPVPTLSGTIAVGRKLTAKPGAWKPSGVTFAYQWLRAGKAIKGATKSTYTLVPADKGKKISVKVTGSLKGYASATKTSATQSVKAGKLTATPTPTIGGTAKVGKALKAKAGKWRPATVKLGYQWQRNGKKIKGATKSSYKLVKADKGKRITVKVTGSKAGYTSVTKTSKATKKVG